MTNEYSIDGFVKVEKSVGGGFVVVCLWNPETKAYKHLTVDDYEYPYCQGPYVNREYTPAQLDYISYEMPYFGDSKEIKKAYEEWCYESDLKAGHIRVGMTVEVIKGRKYPKGTTGIVKGFYDWKDRYGRTQTTYVVTEDGKRIPWENCKPIA